MIDVFPPSAQGLDMGVFDTTVPRATNILSVQLGSLAYAEELGIDLQFFLSEQFSFQNESFKAYLIETLANKGINVAELGDTVYNLFRKYTFKVSADESSTGLIAR